MFLSMPNAYSIAMEKWRVFEIKLDFEFVQDFQKKNLAKVSYLFLLGKTICHQFCLDCPTSNRNALADKRIALSFHNINLKDFF